VAASRTGEPAAHVARQLQFLYTQLVSILTRKGLEHVFKKRLVKIKTTDPSTDKKAGKGRLPTAMTK
jgi:hypothetical protein